METYEVNITQACRVINLSKSVYYYKLKESQDDQVISMLSELSKRHPTNGFWKLFHRIRLAGMRWNHKRVYRVYKQMNLNIKVKRKKRLPSRNRVPLVVPGRMNETWSMDFMSDALENGRKFRTLNIMDDFNRKALAIEADFSLPATRVIRVLERIIYFKGKPKRIRVDNGPEFTSAEFTDWCADNNIAVLFIQPGKPSQNGFIERFNKSYRTAKSGQTDHPIPF